MVAVTEGELLFATPRLDVPDRWRAPDRDGFAEINADPAVMRFIGDPLSRNDSDGFADYGEGWRSAGLGLLPVIRRSDGAFLGLCGLHHMRWYPDDVEVGWRFAPRAWGHGYATEAAERWLDHAFGSAGLDRVISITRLEHDRSVGVMHRLGMVEALRDRKADRSGAEVAVIVHAVDRATWISGRGTADAGAAGADTPVTSGPMSDSVVVVTDSTAYLPEGMAERYGVTVVPLQVVLAGRALAEGVDVTSAEVAAALVADVSVTTSRPPAQAFVDTYLRLHEAGATSIVSLHLSGDISGTVDAARTAAREVAGTIDVEVVDSRSLGMGLGFAVLTAVELSQAGRPAKEAAHEAALRALDTAIYLYVDTLEYLRRGGRINATQARIGSALAVKPVLHVVDGRLEPLDRVRTTERAIARLVEAAVGEAGDKLVDLAVQHLAAPERAQDVADRLRRAIPNVRDVHVSEVGAVVGAHVGPGMVAVAVSPIPASITPPPTPPRSP